jgi:hypothetical protein
MCWLLMWTPVCKVQLGFFSLLCEKRCNSRHIWIRIRVRNHLFHVLKIQSKRLNQKENSLAPVMEKSTGGTGWGEGWSADPVMWPSPGLFVSFLFGFLVKVTLGNLSPCVLRWLPVDSRSYKLSYLSLMERVIFVPEFPSNQNWVVTCLPWSNHCCQRNGMHQILSYFA